MTASPEERKDTQLSSAVDKTRGFQPWRRLFHATNGTLVVLALTVFSLEPSTALIMLGILSVLLLGTDLARLLLPDLNLLFFRTFQPLASPREEKKLASSTWYAVSVVLVLLLFPLHQALAGILVLALADPFAAVVGWKWGKRPFGTGTVAGSGACFVVACAALLVFVPWWAALPTALVATVVEAAPLPLDDNLILPIAVSVTLALIGA
jgi:dolichol kinase